MSRQDPAESTFRCAEAVYELIAHDRGFSRVRRLMEVDWSAADVTVEDLGLPRLLRTQAQKLWSLIDAGSDGEARTRPGELAEAIRFTERHDTLARDALWWLGELSFDPLLRGSGRRR